MRELAKRPRKATGRVLELTLAEQIALELFTDGLGNRVERLALMGDALIRWRDKSGIDRHWLIAASLCPLRPDSEATLRAHFDLVYGGEGGTFVSATITPRGAAPTKAKRKR